MRVPGIPASQEISPSQASTDQSGTNVPGEGLPPNLPALASLTSPLCVSYGPGLAWRITDGGTVPSGAAASSNAATDVTGGAQVDQV